jgi:hypothetical protein
MHRFVTLILARYFRIVVHGFTFKYKHLKIYERYITG